MAAKCPKGPRCKHLIGSSE
uniref:Uncharacterized protein n=1 Tax=Arundo donax TaxID=35708 RepID=A0A0A9BT23_ARUDO